MAPPLSRPYNRSELVRYFMVAKAEEIEIRNKRMQSFDATIEQIRETGARVFLIKRENFQFRIIAKNGAEYNFWASTHRWVARGPLPHLNGHNLPTFLEKLKEPS